MIDVLLWLLALTLGVLYAYFRPGWRRTGPYLPDSFVAGLALFAVGATINEWQLPSHAAREVAAMGWAALCSGLLGAIGGALATRPPASFADHVSSSTATIRAEQLLVRCGLIFSALVCVAFTYAVLSSAPLSALLSFASLFQDSSLLSVRKMITAGTDGYFAPGYVKQFRDILIPVLLSALVAMNRRFYKSVLFWAVVCIALVAMLISGQRLIVVVSSGTLLLACYYVTRVRLRTLLVASGLVLIAYGALTVLLGRVEQRGSPAEAAADIAVNVIDRVVLTVPRENTITHSVWGTLGPTMGSSWLDDLSGILPGPHRARLSNVLHASAGGSDEGNSPLALAVDTWLAWGWTGLALVPALFAFGLALLDRVLLSRRSVTLFGLKVYLALAVPIFYSPYLFLLYGGAVAVVLVAAIRVIRPARRRAAGFGGHPFRLRAPT